MGTVYCTWVVLLMIFSQFIDASTKKKTEQKAISSEMAYLLGFTDFWDAAIQSDRWKVDFLQSHYIVSMWTRGMILGDHIKHIDHYLLFLVFFAVICSVNLDWNVHV